jgi:hypothetical protein
LGSISLATAILKLITKSWCNVTFSLLFHSLVSYGRFVEWMSSTLLPLCAFVRSCFGDCSGISFMDSTSLKVCYNRRILQHKVFENIAARGKTSMDWFFGNKAALGRQRQRRVARASS